MVQSSIRKRNGFSVRVDHRTLQAQKEEAEQNGDTFLARFFAEFRKNMSVSFPAKRMMTRKVVVETPTYLRAVEEFWDSDTQNE